MFKVGTAFWNQPSKQIVPEIQRAGEFVCAVLEESITQLGLLCTDSAFAGSWSCV